MNDRYAQFLLLVLIWFGLIVSALFARPLLPVDETRYLTVAWEMWQRGDFLVPHLNGATYSHKPPLLFWAMHLGWAAFGVNEWSPRLVAPLFGLASLALTWCLARALWPERPAIGPAAAFIVLGAAFWTVFTTVTMFDLLHVFFTLSGVLGLLLSVRGRTVLGFALFGGAIGLGVLAKGPAILVHLMPVAVTAPVWAPALGYTGGWTRWYGGIVGGVLLGAAIGLAWALPAGSAGGDAYREAILWGQSAGRMVKSFAHQRPFWWYGAVLPAMVLPWLIWPAAGRALLRQGRSLLADGAVRLCVVWFAAAFLVFSLISGKQPHYLLPEFPALALLLARAVDGMASGRAAFWRPVDKFVPATFVVLIALIIAAAALLGFRPGWATSVGDLKAWPVALILVAVAVYWFRPGTGLAGRTAAISGLMAVAVIGLHLAVKPVVLASHDFRAFSERLKEFEDRGHRFVTFGKYHGQFHFLGRLTQPIAVVDGPANLEKWLADQSKAMVVSLKRDLPPGAAPSAQVRFRGRLIGVWRAEVYPGRVRQP